MEPDKPDREPFCKFDLEGIPTSQQREQASIINHSCGFNSRDPFLCQVNDTGIPYSHHKEMIHDSFSHIKKNNNSARPLSNNMTLKRTDPSTQLRTGTNKRQMPESQVINGDRSNPGSNLAEFEKFRSSFETFSANKSDMNNTYDKAYHESINLSRMLDNKGGSAENRAADENPKDKLGSKNMFTIH